VPLHVRAQLERELEVDRELDYGGYFLTMWDIVQFCRRTGILCQGRGSAANSAVCYCLGITAIDPVRMDLLFERFISRERAEPPDIDLDIEHERREEVIQYVYQRYGRRRAAMVAMLARYRPRSAVREVGKALGVAAADDRPRGEAAEPLRDRDRRGDGRRGGGRRCTPLHAHWLRLSAELENFPQAPGDAPGRVPAGARADRHAGPGRAGGDDGADDRAVGQARCRGPRLFKVDLLGLGALHHVHNCFDMIREHHGVDLTMATVPAEDPATYAMLSARRLARGVPGREPGADGDAAAAAAEDFL
jgi:error-prone DNA polymerase